MQSLRTRITLMTVCAVIFSVIVVTLLSAVFIQRTEHSKTDQLLLLLCETGERNLDYYFNSVQKSVGRVASFVEADLSGLRDEELEGHIDRVREYFDEMASKTNGVLTYYYRIDPAVSSKVKGFWYTDIDGSGFTEHEVTDITLYDTEDTSKLVWFTVPKHTRESIWLPPYVTDNLDVRVISYNAPIVWRDQFVGVVGIEIEYSAMAEQVDSIRLYGNGYAFLNDDEGNIFYHPHIDVTQLTEETAPPIPDGLVSESTFYTYTFEGVEKEAAWLPLGNGMRLNVTAPLNEMEGDWQQLVWNILVGGAGVLMVSCLFTMYYTKHITRPIEELIEAAEHADRGDYEYELEYNRDDEVGRLTSTFKRLASHMKDNISTLNKQVYVDPLTHVKNKGAFSLAIEELQTELEESSGQLEFAVGVFDCDELKLVNDQYGHDKGDAYLLTASHLICRVFQHSPVFRIGGDEFAVILRNDDYRDREALVGQFEEDAARINTTHADKWEQVHVSMGISVYDPGSEGNVIDVVRSADKSMYENKRVRKSARRAAAESSRAKGGTT